MLSHPALSLTNLTQPAQLLCGSFQIFYICNPASDTNAGSSWARGSGMGGEDVLMLFQTSRRPPIPRASGCVPCALDEVRDGPFSSQLAGYFFLNGSYLPC